jgi:hypothetical protein
MIKALLRAVCKYRNRTRTFGVVLDQYGFICAVDKLKGGWNLKEVTVGNLTITSNEDSVVFYTSLTKESITLKFKGRAKALSKESFLKALLKLAQTEGKSVLSSQGVLFTKSPSVSTSGIFLRLDC